LGNHAPSPLLSLGITNGVLLCLLKWSQMQFDLFTLSQGHRHCYDYGYDHDHLLDRLPGHYNYMF
jgi:hypothetical protein